MERDLGLGQETASKWIIDKKKFQEDAFCGRSNVRLLNVNLNPCKKKRHIPNGSLKY